MSDISDRLRKHVTDHGGPAKDADGNFIGTVWPLMLEAADEIGRLRATIRVNALRWGHTDAEIETILNQREAPR